MLEDIPIFVEGHELVERPRFADAEELAAYLARIAEGRDFVVNVEHPHDEYCKILSIYIGSESPYRCPHGCDDAAYGGGGRG